MKRVIVGMVVGTMLGGAVTAFAMDKFPKHPNLQKAYSDLEQATKHITAAQGANEYDMSGHAAKAKELIGQAIGELDQAAHEANVNKKR